MKVFWEVIFSILLWLFDWLIELRSVFLGNNGELSWRGISASLVSTNELTLIGV